MTQSIVGVGLCSKYFDLKKMPAWSSAFAFFGYHGDDGYFYESDAEQDYGPTFGEENTIGIA